MDQTRRDGKTPQLRDFLSAKVTKRSVSIAGHLTSVSIEQPFWDELGRIAEQRGNSSLHSHCPHRQRAGDKFVQCSSSLCSVSPATIIQRLSDHIAKWSKPSCLVKHINSGRRLCAIASLAKLHIFDFLFGPS
jgi:hypothetical protein